MKVTVTIENEGQEVTASWAAEPAIFAQRLEDCTCEKLSEMLSDQAPALAQEMMQRMAPMLGLSTVRFLAQSYQELRESMGK